MPPAADHMRLAALCVHGNLRAHVRRRPVLQPVQIASAEVRRAGERIGDRVRDRGLSLVVVARDGRPAAERPAVFVCKAAEAGNGQLFNLQRSDLRH